jgi:hypothetical protein
MTTTNPSRAARPNLESLEDRSVPSAVLDLTTRGATGGLGGALFGQVDAQPTGTGHINSFLRIQGKGVEQGYNTDARPVQFDENTSPNFTRALRLSDVPLRYVDGVAYRVFLLDINQSSSSPLLSLDELRFYVGGAPNVSGYDAAAKTLGGMSAVWDLDAGGDAWVKMDYRLNHGSGSGDVLVYVPAAAFIGSGPDAFVAVYSKFGENLGANAGFEEWAVLPTGDAPALSSLSGYVYFDANNNGVFDDGESGIAGVTVTLTGIDDYGNVVQISQVTDENGFYAFGGLNAGTYELAETQPDGYLDGSESLGTAGGVVGSDVFYITLLPGVDGRDYNFGEILFAGS